MNPGPILIIRNIFPLYLLAVLLSPLINYENTKNIFFLICFLFAYLHFYLQSPPSSPLLFAITTITFTFICFVFPICFFFLESVAKLVKTCDTLTGKQGSLFFLLHVGSILTYSNLCYFDPVLLQAINCALAADFS